LKKPMNPQPPVFDRETRNDLLATLVESSQDAIIAKDLHGIIQTWNKGAEQLYGYRPDEAIGRSAVFLLPSDRSNEEPDILSRIRAGESVNHFETTRLRKDGTLISVSLSISPIRDQEGEIVGASHVARNISERTLMEAASAQLAAIVENSEDAIISKNLEGVILTWNAGAERIYGYPAEEVRWRHISILLPPDRRAEEDAILERLKRGERVDHFETVRVRKDGRLIDVSLTISPIRDNGGAVRGASHIARDITLQKTFQANILQTQKLESLGVLAGGVAHDFNNLLVGILANSSLLANSLSPSNPQRAILAEIVTAAERAAGLTRQLLAYAGKGRFVTEPVNLSALIREINTLIQASIPPRVQVRLELQDDLPPVEGDISQLQQVIMNLVINGGEAIGDKPGLVVVTSGVQEVDKQYADTVSGRSELKPGQYVVVEVNDSGNGMDEETLLKIFDPFFTTKFAGRGLGLAAVLGIVRGHKGALKVYSAPGKGSTFKLFFPVTSAGSAAPAAQVAGAELAGRGTVLVVDDEELVRKAATFTLQRYGYQVLAAASGREAIQIFRNSGQPVTLVLLDLTMPGMDGEEVLRELKLIEPAVRVLLSSGFNEVESVRRFTGKGLAGFIQKPYTAQELGAKVKQILDFQSRAAPNASR
jgi:PAS domain S-box-containing protein